MTVEYVKQVIVDELKSLEDSLQNEDSRRPLTSYYDVYYNPKDLLVVAIVMIVIMMAITWV